MTTKTSVTDDLRVRLGACKSRQQELLTERSEIAYSATVEKDRAAIKRLEEINGELAALTNETSVLESALKEAHRRESAAEDAARAEKRRSNAGAAAEVLLETKATAALLAKAMLDTCELSSKLRAQFADMKNLTGAGPTAESVQVNLSRSLTTAVMNSPMKIAHLAPSDRCTIDAIVDDWSASIRNWITAALGDKPAKAA